MSSEGVAQPDNSVEAALVGSSDARESDVLSGPRNPSGAIVEGKSKRKLIISVTGAAFVLLVAAAVALAGGGSSNAEIKGMFTLFDVSDVSGDPDDCEGDGGYSDVDAGMPVTVRNAQGDIVGSSTTRHGTIEELAVRTFEVDHKGEKPTDDERARIRKTLEDVDGFICPLMFEVEVDEADFYEIQVGRRGSLSYRTSELAHEGWVVAFSLGN